jgi:hypothetical protein
MKQFKCTAIIESDFKSTFFAEGYQEAILEFRRQLKKEFNNNR